MGKHANQKRINRAAIKYTLKVLEFFGSDFKTTNKLSFEINISRFNDGSLEFIVGSCRGLFYIRLGKIQVNAVVNRNEGNGQVKDVFEWFEEACKRFNLELQLLNCWNTEFKNYLINKRGFVETEKDLLIKNF